MAARAFTSPRGKAAARPATRRMTEVNFILRQLQMVLPCQRQLEVNFGFQEGRKNAEPKTGRC